MSSGKVCTDDCSAGLFLGEAALPLYYSESRTRSRDYTIILFFSGFVVVCFFMSFYTVYVESNCGVSGNEKLGLNEMTIIHKTMVVGCINVREFLSDIFLFIMFIQNYFLIFSFI